METHRRRLMVSGNPATLRRLSLPYDSQRPTQGLSPYLLEFCLHLSRDCYRFRLASPREARTQARISVDLRPQCSKPKKHRPPRRKCVRYAVSTVVSAGEYLTEWPLGLWGQTPVLRQGNREASPILRQDVCLEGPQGSRSGLRCEMAH